jgi:hypothetical protein
VVAGERDCAAIANEVDNLGRRGRAKPDDVAQARDLVDARTVDCGNDPLQRVEAAVDVGDHSDARHR